MKNFERIMAMIALLAIILKLLNIAGSQILIMLIFTTLSIFYYAFSFAFFNGIPLRNIFEKSSYKNTNAKRIIGAICVGFALSLIIIGGQFKLLFLSGATYLLATGLMTTGFILMIAVIFYFRNKHEFYKRMLKRIGIIGGLGLVLYLTSAETLVDIYYRNQPEYAALYKKLLADPENRELQEQLRQMELEIQMQEYKDEFENNE